MSPRQDEGRLRHVLVLRMLVMAWLAEPRASWRKLAILAVANGAQQEPPVKPREVEALRGLTVGELFDPDAAARAKARDKARDGRSRQARRPAPSHPATDK
jgi:hypothetical protein